MMALKFKISDFQLPFKIKHGEILLCKQAKRRSKEDYIVL